MISLCSALPSSRAGAAASPYIPFMKKNLKVANVRQCMAANPHPAMPEGKNNLCAPYMGTLTPTPRVTQSLSLRIDASRSLRTALIRAAVPSSSPVQKSHHILLGKNSPS